MRNHVRETDNLLTAQEVAEAANLSKQTVLNYAKEGTIIPDLRLSNGQCLFKEDVITILMSLSFSKEYKDNVLVTCFGSDEECKEFEEQYDRYLKERRIQRIDDMKEYLEDCRNKLKSNIVSHRVYVAEAIETTMRTCEKKVKSLSAEMYKHLVSHPKIEDGTVFWEHRDNILDVKGIAPRLSENDKRIYNLSLQMYRQKIERVEESYALKEMREQVKLFKGLRKDERLEYEPQKPAVRAIWRKVEQHHIRESIKVHMREHLADGYVSVLCLNPQKDKWIYELISKAMNPCIRKIEIYCMTDITSEMQQVFDGLDGYKEVVFQAEMPWR